jgi:GMP synthase (glutamine-hydrolysing)
MAEALAIRHVPFEDLGSFAPVLADRGFSTRYVEAPGGLGGEDPLTADLVVVLGGPIGVYEEDLYPFVREEIALLQRRLVTGAPTLGICLGAQLMARALGARVYAGGTKEIGWAPIHLTAEGSKSPLGALAGRTVLHWHGDTFDLPAGATLLASTDLYANQAFFWSEKALALQFHPEVTPAGLEYWFVGHALEIAATTGVDVPGLRAGAERHGDDLVQRGQACLRAWLERIGL